MERIEARVSRGYRLRLAATCLGCIAFGSWFFYDYAVGYPAKREMQQTFQELKQTNPNDFNQRWETVALEKGWPTAAPDAPYSQSKIDQQLYFAIPCYAVAAWFGLGFLRLGGRWVAADARGLSTSKGLHVAWDEVRGLNDDRWATKGIAFVTYRTKKAEAGHILLDDWKYDREPTKAIHREVALHVRPDGPGHPSEGTCNPDASSAEISEDAVSAS